MTDSDILGEIYEHVITKPDFFRFLFLEKSFDDKIKDLQKHGYKMIECENLGDYKIFLIDIGDSIEVGLTSFDHDFVSASDQLKTNKSSGGGISFKRFLEIIKIWFNKYKSSGKLFNIGSANQRKTEFYRKILSKQFTIGEVEHVKGTGAFPDTLNFQIFGIK